MVQTPNDSVCRSASLVSSGALARPLLKQLSGSHCFVLRQHLLGFMTAASCLTGALDMIASKQGKTQIGRPLEP